MILIEKMTGSSWNLANQNTSLKQVFDLCAHLYFDFIISATILFLLFEQQEEVELENEEKKFSRSERPELILRRLGLGDYRESKPVAGNFYLATKFVDENLVVISERVTRAPPTTTPTPTTTVEGLSTTAVFVSAPAGRGAEDVWQP